MRVVNVGVVIWLHVVFRESVDNMGVVSGVVVNGSAVNGRRLVSWMGYGHWGGSGH